MISVFGELTPFLILAMIAGIVEFAKQFGVEGRWSLVLSLILGLVLGIGFQISELGVPVDFAGWFSYDIFAALFGLTASGLYDLGKKFTGNIEIHG